MNQDCGCAQGCAWGSVRGEWGQSARPGLVNQSSHCPVPIQSVWFVFARIRSQSFLIKHVCQISYTISGSILGTIFNPIWMWISGLICSYIRPNIGSDTITDTWACVLAYLYDVFKWYARWCWPYCRQWKRFPRLVVLVLCHIDPIRHAHKVTGIWSSSWRTLQM